MFALGATAIGVEGACRDRLFAVSPPDPTGMVTFTSTRPVVLRSFGLFDGCTIRFRLRRPAGAHCRRQPHAPRPDVGRRRRTRHRGQRRRHPRRPGVGHPAGHGRPGHPESGDAGLGPGEGRWPDLRHRHPVGRLRPHRHDHLPPLRPRRRRLRDRRRVHVDPHRDRQRLLPVRPLHPERAGTYRWVASYSGDATNAPVANSCNDPDESVTVVPTAPRPPPRRRPRRLHHVDLHHHDDRPADDHHHDVPRDDSTTTPADDHHDGATDHDDRATDDTTLPTTTTSTSTTSTTTTTTTTTRRPRPRRVPTTTTTTVDHLDDDHDHAVDHHHVGQPTTAATTTTTGAHDDDHDSPSPTTRRRPRPRPTTTSPTTCHHDHPDDHHHADDAGPDDHPTADHRPGPTTTPTHDHPTDDCRPDDDHDRRRRHDHDRAPTTTSPRRRRPCRTRGRRRLPAPPCRRAGPAVPRRARPARCWRSTGRGYGDCAQVYFFLDGRRIGSYRPDSTGEVHVGVDVPGDLDAGQYSLRGILRHLRVTRRGVDDDPRVGPRPASLGRGHRAPQAVRHRSQCEVGRRQRPPSRSSSSC